MTRGEIGVKYKQTVVDTDIMDTEKITRLDQLEDGIYYRVSDLKEILKNLNLLYSIYTIRDYETWKCLDYKCGKRNNEEVLVCAKCKGAVREPLIPSPRTRGGGKGPGHRRSIASEIRKIIRVFKKRV